MKNFDIEIDSAAAEKIKQETEKKAVQLPLNFLTIGEIENDDVKVYIKQDVYKKLEKYAVSDTAHELGTIILGDYSEELGKMHVIISDFIYAKYTDASASTLTFTHETWDYVNKEHDEKYPDKKIVGWQHTHPGYGIFLSNYDLFIQENFFNLPFQVAYVIDPVQQLRGFFQWKNGKIEKLKGFYIYDELGKTIKIEQPKAKGEKADKTSEAAASKLGKFQPIALGVLSVVTAGLLIAVVSLSQKYTKQLENQQILESRIEEQGLLLTGQTNQPNTEAQRNVGTTQDNSENVQNNSGETQGNSGEAQGNTGETQNNPGGTEVPADTAAEENKSTDSPTEETHTVTFRTYTIQSGDSLETVCQQYGLDYPSAYKMILSINGIDDANQIYTGETILLPLKNGNQ